MISKEEYKKTVVRIWDSVRDDVFKGESSCNNVCCGECPINFGCGSVMKYHELVEFVEKWAKEHPIETNGSRFLRNFPKAEVYDRNYGFVYVRLDENANGNGIFPATWWESEVNDADCD